MSDSKEHKFKVGDKVVPFPTEFGTLSAYLVAGSTYTVTKIHENGRVDVEGTFKYDGNGTNWDSDWFKPYEEDEVKVENTMTAESLRNSILSLQQERVSLQEKIEQNIAQEKSLTEQLKELGFLLVKSKEQPTNVVDEKHTLDAVKVGDTVECISTDDPGYRVGKLYTEEGEVYTVSDVEHLKGVDKIKVDVKEVDGGIGIMGVNYRFHSRPVVN